MFTADTPPDPADTLDRLRASAKMLMESPSWSGQGSRTYKVYIAATMLLAGSSDGTLRIHPATLADATDLRVDKVREVLRELDALGVLRWEQEFRSSDLGVLALPEPPRSVDDIIARARARQAKVPPLQRRSALQVFGEKPSAADTDRDPRRG